MKIPRSQYTDEVLNYLEYLGYPEMVEYFDPECIARSLFPCIVMHHALDISVRICAIIIWSLTMEMQIIPSVAGMTKQ